MGKTLFDKIWDSHIVKNIEDGPSVLYIDRQFIHEVTSPQAFDGLRKRGIKVLRPERTFATPDHNVPTENQHLDIKEELSRFQVQKLTENCEEFGIKLFNLGSDHHGVVHIIGPELGLTQPGTTIVCGDSHTATHGAFGTIAFGIGTSEIEMVLSSQCLMQVKPKTMRITINGDLKENVNAKDVILYIISQLTTGGGTGYFIEYAGDVFKNMSMEERMTVCNMSIELGARGGLIAVDETTVNYLQNRDYSPKGAEWNDALEQWMELHSDEDAKFDKEVEFKAEDIDVMITYGTTPGMGMSINASIPQVSDIPTEDRPSFEKSLNYMGLEAGTKLKGKPIDYVFIGSCTNGRIEDFRAAAAVAKGRQKADNVTVWLVPGSKAVEKQILEEGLDKIFVEAGMKIRQPGCSACLAMNEDKIPAGKYSVSTSNRNFEGRQGPNSRTFLASPETAMACAIQGKVSDISELN